MVKISISEVKSRQTTAQTVLEKNLEIDKRDIEGTSLRIESLLTELENLREALIYKEEQIKAENTQYNETTFTDFEIAPIFHNETVCDFKEVVEKQNETKQLFLIEKFIKTKQEIEMGGSTEDIIERVFANIEEELEFWCFFLDEYKTSEENFKLRKKTEEKLCQLFEENLDDPRKCALIYKSSFYLNQGYPLIKTFMTKIEILKNPFFCDPAARKPANFDKLECDQKFLEFLGKVQSVYENDLKNVEIVFFDHLKIVEQIGKRLFDDLLATNLDRLLRDSDSATFLQLLCSCYVETKNTCEKINLIFPDFYDTVDVENVFASFVAVVPAKEKTTFDAVYDFLVLKKPLRNEIVMMNEKIKNDKIDENEIFRILIFLLGKILWRYEMFSGLNNPEYFVHYFLKFNEFFGFVEEKFKGDEKFEIMSKIGEFYVLLNDFCKKTGVVGLDVCNHFCESRLNSLFEHRTHQAQTIIKGIFSKLKYSMSDGRNTSESIKSLLDFLSMEVKVSQKWIFGKNSEKFVKLIMEVVYICMRKKMQNYVFNIAEANVLFNDTVCLLGFVKKNSLQSVPTFEYLLEFVELISVEKEELNLFVANVYEKLPDVEINNALKMRSDYKEIKDVLSRLAF